MGRVTIDNKEGKLTIYNEEERRYELVEEPEASYSYSFADYLQWKFQERLELIRGRIYKLSAPNANHAIVSQELLFKLVDFFKREPCRAFIAPFDVRLPRKGRTADHEIKTVVQPDLFVVCDKTKIDEKGCCGAPDLVMEVLSPGSIKHDKETKYALYEEAGVREYWLIDPKRKNVVSYVLEENEKFGAARKYRSGDIVSSVAVAGFAVAVDDIFRNNIEFRRQQT
jgi:Uma2 family endonuclease